MGKSIFISQTGGGNQNGLSFTGSFSVTGFNSSSNWGLGANQISPGDNVYLCGIISGQLVVQSSGASSGNPTTIYFYPGASLISTSGFLAGAINIANTKYITVDGSGYGLIQNTNNGTLFTYQQDSVGVFSDNSSFTTVQNLSLQNIYVRVSGGEQNGFGSCIRAIGSNSTFTNLLVNNCQGSNAYQGINCDYGAGAAFYTLSNNTFSGCNWGIGCGDRSSSSTLSGLVVFGNQVSSWNNWNDGASNSFHHNGVFIFANNGLVINPIIYNNSFGSGFGNSFQTAGIYVNGNISGGLYHDNVFICASGEYAGNGLLVVQSNLTTSYIIANNTFLCGAGNATTIDVSGPSAASRTGTQIITLYNNLGVGGGSGTFISLYFNSGVTLVSDYNLGYNYTSGLNYVNSINGNGNFFTWPQWTGLGFDPHGIVSNPLLNATTLHLMMGSPAIQSGINLSTSFITDAANNPRPGSGPWDIGAYQFLVYRLKRLGAHLKMYGYTTN